MIASPHSKSTKGRGLSRILLSGLLLVPAMGHAQTEAFSIDSWGTRNGLPEVSVQALAIDPSRRIFVGTAGGLCLFDGAYCKPLQNQEMSKFPASNLTALLQTQDHSLWAGTQGGGLLHITADHVEVFDQRNGLDDLYIRAIYEDSTGRLWVGTDDGLFRKSASGFERIVLPTSGGHREVYAIAEDSQHTLLAGGEELIYLKPSDSLSLLPIAVKVPYPVRSLLPTKDGRLILGTLGGGYERTGATFKKLPIPLADVERLCQTVDGAIWAGTVSNGLWRLQGESASQVSIGNDGSSYSILAMSADASGRLWVGSETGLSRIEPTNVHLVPSPAAAVDSETLTLSPKGTIVWVNKQIYGLGSGKPQPIPFHLPGGPTTLLNVLYASDRSVWLGTAGNGVFHLDPDGHPTQYATYSALKIAGNFPRGIVEGANGDVWVATGFGVSRIGRNGIEQFDASNGLPSRNVRAVLRDRNGCMWIGTDGGLALYCAGHFIENRATKSLSGEEISAIAEDSNGTTWLGTRNHGLYAYRGSDLRHFMTSNGLLSNFICGLAADNAGTLWISSPEAISSIPFAQPLAGPRETDFVFARSYSMPKGAEELSFSGRRFPNTLVDADGIVWFASNRGPVYVDRLQTSAHHASDGPVPVITSVLADDAYIQRLPQIRIPSTSKLLTFTFGAIYLGPEKDVLLTYRLQNADERWTVSEGPHQVEYRGLPAGSYTFELRAYSRSQPDLWKDTRMSFVVPVIWYRNVWFYVLLIALLGAVSLMIYILHLQRVKGRFRLVLEERTRLAREMHDTLIQGCNGVAMLLEAEASSRGQSGSKFLNIAREQLQMTVADAREAVWNLRHTEMDSDILIASLKNISAQASESFGIPVVVNHPSRLPNLSASEAHEILMIVREAVTNAGSHGNPRAINIFAQHTGNQLTLRVRDDGIGFDTKATSLLSGDHYGLMGMQERATMIGADLEITSTEGDGTCIEMSLKVQPKGASESASV